MRLYNYLAEALKPSEFRRLMKIKRDKSLYDDIFHGKDRVYLPFSGGQKQIDKSDLNTEDLSVYNKVKDILKLNDYTLFDPAGKVSMLMNYINGVAYHVDTEKQYKLSKLLNKLSSELLQKFNNDPLRQNSKISGDNTQIVISRHPYDIAGMSTGRGWTSCMNLKDGCNKDYVDDDIKQGTCVAYLIKKTDTNIQNPISRVLLKPYHVNGTDEVVLKVASKVYGADVNGFKEAIQEFIDKSQKAPEHFIAKMSREVYNDNDDKEIRRGNVVTDDDIGPNEEFHGIYDASGFTFGGIFKSGLFLNGTFYSKAEWKGGTWVNGKIYSKKFRAYIPSKVDPIRFKKMEEDFDDVDIFERHVNVEKNDKLTAEAIGILWFGNAAHKYGLRDRKEISKKAVQMISTFMNTHELNNQLTYVKAKEYIKRLGGM